MRFARVVALDVAHHITQRGNARRFILETDTERGVYLDLLQQGIQRHGVELILYCLMSNHVHLVAVPQSKDALARNLKQTHGRSQKIDISLPNTTYDVLRVDVHGPRQCHLVFEHTRGIRREGPKLRMDSELLYVFVVGERNAWLQTALIEAAKLAPRWNPQLAQLYAQQLQRGHANRATLQVARKLVAYLLAVDKNGQPFQVRTPPPQPKAKPRKSREPAVLESAA